MDEDLRRILRHGSTVSLGDGSELERASGTVARATFDGVRRRLLRTLEATGDAGTEPLFTGIEGGISLSNISGLIDFGAKDIRLRVVEDSSSDGTKVFRAFFTATSE